MGSELAKGTGSMQGDSVVERFRSGRAGREGLNTSQGEASAGLSASFAGFFSERQGRLLERVDLGELGRIWVEALT
jgi:hypothetical protein